MNYHVLTLFPEMIRQGLNTSIIGRAIAKGILSLEAVNIRDYAFNKHQKVDDYPYGGGAGMVMQAEPVYQAYKAVCDQTGKCPRVIYLTPQGRVFDQELARELAKEEELIFLCGHYEGIDERVLEEIVTDQVSIGDYVLTGGELPSMVMIDAISRMVPGVLSNLFLKICWNIPSIAGQRNGMGVRSLPCFCRATIKMWTSGGGNSPFCARQSTGQIY